MTEEVKIKKYLKCRALSFNDVVTSAPFLKHAGLIPLSDVIGILEMNEDERRLFFIELEKIAPEMLNNEFEISNRIPLKEKVFFISYRLLGIWFYEKIQWPLIKLLKRKHKHKWQKRAVNRWGKTTYRVCKTCGAAEEWTGGINGHYRACERIAEFDKDFEND